MGLGNILKGHVNELLNLNEQLFNSRMEICNACPLMDKSIVGKVCSRKNYINLKTGDVINIREVPEMVVKDVEINPDFKNGCGCRLDAKTRDIDSSCELGKW